MSKKRPPERNIAWLTIMVLALSMTPLFAGTTLKGYIPTTLGPVPDYISQVDLGSFAQDAYETQQMNEWCWAACVSMVFSFYGHPISQSEIVSNAFGGVIDQAASSGATIALSLNRTWTDDNGKTFRSIVTAAYDFDNHVYGLNNSIMAGELNRNHPVVIAAGDHAMVLTAMEYTGNPGFPANVISCGVFDPLPGREARLLTPPEMTPMNLGGAFRFAATFKIEAINSAPTDDADTDDDFKKSLRKIADSASDRFSSIKGSYIDRDDDSTSFQCTVSLPGSISSDITTYKDGSSPIVRFIFLKTTDDDDIAKSKYEEVKIKIRNSLDANWSSQEYEADEDHHYKASFNVQTENGSITIHWRDNNQVIVDFFAK